MKPDSLILDIDGTLWNSTPIVADAWNEYLACRPDISVRFTDKMLMKLFGKTLNTVADIVFPFLEEQERYALIDACCEQEHKALYASDQDILYPGVKESIPRLAKKYKLFIVSNCQSGYIELFLEKTGLGPYITDFECPGRTGLEKSDNMRLVADRNHLKSPVYVGDIEGDRAAAVLAGIPFCHAAYGFGEVENPDYAIHAFSDLLSIF